MATSLHKLGLQTLDSRSNYTPAFLAFHFIWAYGVLSSRTAKQVLGLDHNASPRYDLRDYGEDAVRSGKITRSQLDMMKRMESASANAVENYTLLVGAMCMANVSGVDTGRINAAGTIYTVARIAYGIIYTTVSHPWWSQMRGITWWVGNVSCLYLLWHSWVKMNP